MPPSRTSHVRPLTAIRPARNPGDFAAGLQLVREYARWVESTAGIPLQARQATWQSELDDLAGIYSPPRGELLLARVDGRPLGTAGVLLGDDRVAELKRMYVAPAARGLGLGSDLLRAAVASARALGARRVWLETSRRFMGRAVELYEAAGFVPGPAHEFADQPGAMTMQLVLEP
jgi:GNAT superfamily N-acetyltransferase